MQQATREIDMQYVNTNGQLTNMLTKSLPGPGFSTIRGALGIVPAFIWTAQIYSMFVRGWVLEFMFNQPEILYVWKLCCSLSFGCSYDRIIVVFYSSVFFNKEAVWTEARFF
jgi:hypothetical protein